MDEQSEFQQELDLLQATYFDQLEVSGSNQLQFTLYPHTANEKEQQYVKLVLMLKIPNNYPSEIPSISIQSTRGLSDNQILEFITKIKSRATESTGQLMIYDLVELTKDLLTENNAPTGTCPICLDSFESRPFLRTECFHTFHFSCINRYLANRRQYKAAQNMESVPHMKKSLDTLDDVTQTVCPVCREHTSLLSRTPLSEDRPHDAFSSSIDEEENEEIEDTKIELSESQKELQRKMAALFEKQKLQGGIIDLEKEAKRTFIDISTPPPQPQPVVAGTDATVAQIPAVSTVNSQSHDAKSLDPNQIASLDTNSVKTPASKPVNTTTNKNKPNHNKNNNNNQKNNNNNTNSKSTEETPPPKQEQTATDDSTGVSEEDNLDYIPPNDDFDTVVFGKSTRGGGGGKKNRSNHNHHHHNHHHHHHNNNNNQNNNNNKDKVKSKVKKDAS